MLNSVKSKVIISIVALSISGLVAISYYLVNTFNQLSNNSAKRSLNMLSESIFQTMTTSMMMGDPDVVEQTFHNARKIDGIEDLNIAKSHAVLDFYAPDEPFTKDPLLADVINNKSTKLIETNENEHHTIRLIRPMTAEQRCLQCHSNAEVGTVLGAMDLIISLDKNDQIIQDTNKHL